MPCDFLGKIWLPLVLRFCAKHSILRCAALQVSRTASQGQGQTCSARGDHPGGEISCPYVCVFVCVCVCVCVCGGPCVYVFVNV